MVEIIEKIRRIHAFNNQIFTFISNQMSQADDTDFEVKLNIREFAPPVHPRASQRRFLPPEI
jgi:hypothetical protein